MRRREHQSGFGTTVIILAVLVVVALAVTGLTVYQHHKPSSANKAQLANTSVERQSQVTQNTTAPTATYFTIKEWGVRAPYNGPLNLQYIASNSGSMSLERVQKQVI